MEKKTTEKKLKNWGRETKANLMKEMARMARNLQNQEDLEKALRLRINKQREMLEENGETIRVLERRIENLRGISRRTQEREVVERKVASYYKEELAVAHTLLGRLLHQTSESQQSVNLGKSFPTANSFFPGTLRGKMGEEETAKMERNTEGCEGRGVSSDGLAPQEKKP